MILIVMMTLLATMKAQVLVQNMVVLVIHQKIHVNAMIYANNIIIVVMIMKRCVVMLSQVVKIVVME